MGGEKRRGERWRRDEKRAGDMIFNPFCGHRLVLFFRLAALPMKKFFHSERAALGRKGNGADYGRGDWPADTKVANFDS